MNGQTDTGSEDKCKDDCRHIFHKTIELIPIPMEQSPKSIFRLVMIRSLIKFRAKRPIKPPRKMHNALMMIPMGIDKNLLSKKILV